METWRTQSRTSREGHVRVFKSSLEKKLQQHVLGKHPMLTRCKNCLTRHRIGEDGKTAVQRGTGKRCVKPAREFGERIHLRPAVAPEPRSGLQPRMIEGRLCATSFQDRKHPFDDERRHRERWSRKSLEESWDLVEFENLKGTPWQFKEPRAVVLKLPMIAGGKALRSFQKSVENRSNGKLYVLRGDVELFGSPLGNVHATNVGIILKRTKWVASDSRVEKIATAR